MSFFVVLVMAWRGVFPVPPTAPAPPSAPAAPSAPTAPSAPAAPTLPPDLNGTGHWEVDGVTRTAIIHAPSKKPEGGAPVIFVFHGLGGNSKFVERQFALHKLWPEAVVLYPQGLPTKTRLSPNGDKPGWQMTSGTGDDRDLKFFDAMLKSLKTEGWVDPSRVYVTGHSNGGALTFLLSAVRNDTFAAAAPCAAATLQLASVKPIAMLQIAGKQDKIVPFEGQERMMKFMRQTNKCAEEGTEWAPGCVQYASSIGTPFVTYIHDGGHEISARAPELIVKFFKEHAKAAVPGKPAPPSSPPAKGGAQPPQGHEDGTPKS